MTGDQTDRDDELHFDDSDESFILDDWDELDSVLSDVEAHLDESVLRAASDELVESLTDGAAGDDELPSLEDEFEPNPPAPSEELTEDEILFSGGPRRESGRVGFQEDASSEWAGEQRSADDIGIPVDAYAGIGDLADEETDLGFADDPDFGKHDDLFAEQHPTPAEPAAETPPEKAPKVFGIPDATGEFGVAEVDVDFGDEADDGGFLEEQSDSGEEWDLSLRDETEDPSATTESFPIDPTAPTDDPEIEVAQEYDDPSDLVDGIDQGVGIEEDPIYGDRGEDDDEFEDDYQDAPDYSEHEEAYVDENAQRPVMVTGGPRERSAVVSWISGIAAVLMVGLGAGVVVMKPEWVGLVGAPELVDRTVVARPTLDLSMAPPSISAEESAVGGPAGTTEIDPVATVSDPVTPDPKTPDPVASDQPTTAQVTTDPVVISQPEATDPVAISDPVEPDPAPQPVLAPLDPAQEGSVVVIGDTAPADGQTESQHDLVAMGDDLQVGGKVDVEALFAAPDGLPVQAEEVYVGETAFALLRNGNFFVGGVKKYAPGEVTLRLPGGEVSLPVKDLHTLGNTQDPDYLALQQSGEGFIRLNNSNRLVGSLRRNAEDGTVSLSMKSNRIIIPESVIKELGVRAGSFDVEDSGDEAWIQQLVERRLEGSNEPASPAGDPGGVPPRK